LRYISRPPVSKLAFNTISITNGILNREFGQ
jgi:hypothetical protein